MKEHNPKQNVMFSNLGRYFFFNIVGNAHPLPLPLPASEYARKLSVACKNN